MKTKASEARIALDSLRPTSEKPQALEHASSRRLTVALVSPGWPPEHVSNGIATYVETIRVGLTSIGHRPLVFANSVGLPHPPVDVIAVARRTKSLFSRTLRWVNYRLKGQPAIVRWQAERLRQSLLAQHAKTPIDLLEVEETFGLASHLIGRMPFPVVVKMHGPACIHGPLFGESQYLYPWRLAAERNAIEQAEGLTSPAATLLMQVREALDLPLPDAVTLPNPTTIVEDTDLWRIEGAEPARIVFIGRFDRHKGGDLLIEAFAKVLRLRPDAFLTIIGPDPGLLDDEGTVWHAHEYVQRVFPDQRDQARIEILGKQPIGRLNEWRRRASVVVVPSRYENFPNSVLEAAALGAPIVAADAGGIPEIITHRITGRLFEAGCASALATELLWMLENPKESARLGANARKHCNACFSPQRAAIDAVAFYESVIARWLKKQRSN